MMTGYETFCLYQALKLHFTSEKYNYFTYNGKTHVSLNSFENRKDKYHFHKLARKYTNKDDMIFFIASNFVENEKTWVGSLLQEEADINYSKHQKVIQSLTYFFENDCDKLFSNEEKPDNVLKVVDGEYPILLKRYLRKDVQLETLCILNNILNFVPVWSKQISDTIIWPNHRLKLVKFASFVPFDGVKYKLILKRIVNK
jgi:hypothetical protein